MSVYSEFVKIWFLIFIICLVGLVLFNKNVNIVNILIIIVVCNLLNMIIFVYKYKHLLEN